MSTLRSSSRNDRSDGARPWLRSRPTGRPAAVGRSARPPTEGHPCHAISVAVDERDYFGGRGSSPRAKKADAALRISLARRSSRHLAFQLGDALAVVGRHAGPAAIVDVGLPDPVAQRLLVDSRLLGWSGPAATRGPPVTLRDFGSRGRKRHGSPFGSVASRDPERVVDRCEAGLSVVEDATHRRHEHPANVSNWVKFVSPLVAGQASSCGRRRRSPAHRPDLAGGWVRAPPPP